VGIDRPEDADNPSDDPSARSPENRARFETRSRQEYYDDLHAAVTNQPRTEHPPQQPIGKPWEEVTAWSRRVWTQYEHRFPPEAGSPPEDDDRTVNQELEQECDQIAEQEANRISPALQEVESRDPDRHLIGWEHRLKGRDRIKEKVADVIEQYDRPPKEAIADVPDAIRYTFQYEEASYTRGLWEDTARLKELGFVLVERRNSWAGEQYKGINSRWMDPDSGQRFEVQFHTHISFEAKQITHAAYERLRSGKVDELEKMVLKAFQREISAEIPIPPGAEDIPDYP
jgi:hypothetical protein